MKPLKLLHRICDQAELDEMVLLAAVLLVLFFSENIAEDNFRFFSIFKDSILELLNIMFDFFISMV